MKKKNTKDTVYKNPQSAIERFSFTRKVAEVFDDMALRSIPFYKEAQRMVAELCFQYYQEKTWILDLGCSTGQLVKTLATTFGKRKFIYCGIDNASSMIQKAQKNFQNFKAVENLHFFKGDILDFPFKDIIGEKAFKNPGHPLYSVIVANYTFQFLSPDKRSKLLKKIFQNLTPGGIFLFSEKVEEKDRKINDIFIKNYYQFKKRKGYSKLEISQKREALENVLIPLSTRENEEMLIASGFSQVHLIFKWYNFASFIAVK